MLKHRPYQGIEANEVRFTRAIIILLVSLVLLIATIVLLMQAARTDLIRQWLFNSITTVLFLAWVTHALILTRPAIPSGALAQSDEEYQRRTIDIQQRRNRHYLLFHLVNLIFVGSMVTITFVKPIEGPFSVMMAIILALPAFFSIRTLSSGFPYRRAASDELSRAQRAKAAQFGYILALLEMCAILIAAAYHPHWGLVSLPLAITTAIALPGFYFLYLDWKASRS